MTAKPADGLVSIRLKIDMLGMFHGRGDLHRGDVVDVEAHHAARYFAHGYAQPAELAELGEPYRPC
jgi:hypothetical protein